MPFQTKYIVELGRRQHYITDGIMFASSYYLTVSILELHVFLTSREARTAKVWKAIGMLPKHVLIAHILMINMIIWRSKNQSGPCPSAVGPEDQRINYTRVFDCVFG